MSTPLPPRSDIAFDADGVTLRGWLYRPGPDWQGPRPAVLLSHGFSAIKELDLDRYAEAFARAGFVCLVYDHRNLGASDGLPRGEIDPWRQVQDMRHAISCLRRTPGVDRDRIGLWGTSYSAGHALVVAATDRRVACVVFQAGTIDGFEAARRRLPPDQLDALRARAADDLEARQAGAAPVTLAVAEPGSESYRYLVERGERLGYVNSVTLRSRDLALGYRPGTYVARIAPTPLLMIVADGDTQTPTDLQLAAYEAALPPKRLVLLEGCGHYDVYVARFEETSGAAAAWFTEHLRP
jgi:fermentation-respiration switch protein FrsA (DUF1100 family)